VPKILVGCKVTESPSPSPHAVLNCVCKFVQSDLIDDDADSAAIRAAAKEVAEEIGAVEYIECSALLGRNVRDIFTCVLDYHCSLACSKKKKNRFSKFPFLNKRVDKDGDLHTVLRIPDAPPALPAAGIAPRMYVGDCHLSRDLLRLLTEENFQEKGDVIFCFGNEWSMYAYEYIQAHSVVLRSSGSSVLQKLVPR
jgi:hypothetical protein